jgi:hypothetical protein
MEHAGNVRWTIWISKETDFALRTYLAQTGLKKGYLSEFVVDAVRWRLFDLNMSAVRAANAHVPADEIEDAIEAAVTEVRAERFRKPD